MDDEAVWLKSGRNIQRLDQHDFEHQHRIKGGTPAFASVGIRQCLLQFRAEHLKIHSPGKRFELITKPVQAGKTLVNIKETRLLHIAMTSINAEEIEAYRRTQNQGVFRTLQVHRKKPHLKPMPRHIQKSNTGKSVIRSRVEHVFTDQKSQTGLFVRTVGITRATMRIGLANIVYNMRRFLFLERLNASA